jgi:type IV pilus assembly protein PilN
MVQINLLPWRERAREIKRKNFFIALAVSVGIAIFVILLFHLYYDDVISYQDKRNLFLQSQISQRQVKIDEIRKKKEEQDAIEVELQFLMGLRSKSYRAVSLLNELLKIVPDTITLSKMNRDGNSITLEGAAQSELAITGFLKSISQSPIFNQPVLAGINSATNSTEGTARFFQIKVEQK